MDMFQDVWRYEKRKADKEQQKKRNHPGKFSKTLRRSTTSSKAI